MVDFLTRLAGRALGLERLLQPVRVHRYAGDRRADDPWPQLERSDRSAGAPLQPMSSAQGGRWPGPVSVTTSDAPTAASPEPSLSGDDGLAGGAVRTPLRAAQHGKRGVPAPIVPEVGSEKKLGSRSRSEERPEDDGLLLPKERRREDRAAGDAPPESAARAASRCEPVLPTLTGQHRPAPDRAPTSQAAVTHDHGTAEPSAGVRVSIGKIEIRAVHEPPPTPPRRPSRVHPRLALREYLEQRDRGER